MRTTETLLNRHGDGLKEVVAELTSGEVSMTSMTPEDILILKEDMEERERAAQMASQTGEIELR